jgi:hypothetical protein
VVKNLMVAYTSFTDHCIVSLYRVIFVILDSFWLRWFSVDMELLMCFTCGGWVPLSWMQMLWLNMLNHGGMPYGRMCCRLTTTLSSCVGVLKLEHFRVDTVS